MLKGSAKLNTDKDQQHAGSFILEKITPFPVSPKGESLRGKLAPSLKLLTEQFLNARASPWGKVGMGVKTNKKNRIYHLRLIEQK